TSVAFDRQGGLSSWRWFLRAENPTLVHEMLATLGDSLALGRVSTSATGFAGGEPGNRAYEEDGLVLFAVDAQGRGRRGETFAPDHLGDAIVRLYERYAELLPDGPARVRVAAIARSVAAIRGPVELDGWAATWAPAMEVVDHRMLGSWSARGAE